MVMSGYKDELRGLSDERCMRNEGDGLGLSCCMEEIEKVMEDLQEKGSLVLEAFGERGIQFQVPAELNNNFTLQLYTINQFK